MSLGSSSADIQLAYAQTAHRSPIVYLMLASGLTFVVLGFSIDPVHQCADQKCPDWLRHSAVALGALFVLGAAVALAFRSRWGSRVDIRRRAIIWWNGTPSSREMVISVDDIAVVRVETKWDSDRLILRGRNGKRIMLPDICVPHPQVNWARKLTTLFPHIRFETD